MEVICPLTDEWIERYVVHINTHTHTHLLYIYNGIFTQVIKKEWNNVICINIVGPTDYHTMWSKSHKDKYHMISLTFRILKNMIHMTLFTKQKQTHRYRKQTYSYQWEKWKEESIRSFRLTNTHFYIYNRQTAQGTIFNTL